MRRQIKLMEKGVSKYPVLLVACLHYMGFVTLSIIGKKLDYDPDFKGPIRGKARQAKTG